MQVKILLTPSLLTHYTGSVIWEMSSTIYSLPSITHSKKNMYVTDFSANVLTKILTELNF